MWRSSDNMVGRNALDSCIRGYSHGHDSAGILMFEQCCNNTFGENSVTHGGEGFFAFAGEEALGEHEADWYKGRGHVGNSIQHNDSSYAAVHGFELTFSIEYHITLNRLVDVTVHGGARAPRGPPRPFSATIRRSGSLDLGSDDHPNPT
ncbi:MAG: hypothetical protein GY930_06390 [bacterium]|nr:hypothetical protein [bacterium]